MKLIETNIIPILHYHCREECTNELINHLIEFFSILKAWLAYSFTLNELSALHKRTVKFLKDFLPEYPGFGNMVTHVLLHAKRSVETMGPLRETNMLSFERDYGFISRNINNYRSVVQNAANNMQRLSALHLLVHKLQFLKNHNMNLLTTNLIPDTNNVSRYAATAQFDGKNYIIRLTEPQYIEFHKYVLFQDILLKQLYNRYNNENNHNQFNSFTTYLRGLPNNERQQLTEQQLKLASIPFMPVIRHNFVKYQYFKYYSVLSERNINTANNSWVFSQAKDKIGQIRMILAMEHASQQYKLLYIDWFQRYNQTLGGMEFETTANNLVPKTDNNCLSFTDIKEVKPITITPVRQAVFAASLIA